MVFRLSLLLLLELATVELIFQPKTSCDFNMAVMPREVYAFNNPHFPGTYGAGMICRWVFDCPAEYACRIQCRDVGLPRTTGCFMDKMLVSTNGNLFFEGAQVFCGHTSINSTSVGSRITLGLVSRSGSPGGRFRCTVRTEPWAHPWSRFNYS